MKGMADRYAAGEAKTRHESDFWPTRLTDRDIQPPAGRET